MVSDTYDSGSERWFYLAMVQLGPVDFLKERAKSVSWKTEKKKVKSKF